MIDIKRKIEEFRNKINENPGALFGILYPYILIIILVIGLYYIANLGSVADQKIPAFIPDSTVTKDLDVVEARTVPPLDIIKFKQATPELLSKGKNLYNGICASCHNETGAGGGPGAIGLNPAPRNFTSPDGWKNGRTLSGIYTTLQEGIEGSSMIAYNYMPPEDRIAIAHYIRSEFMVDAPLDTDEELAALDQLYSLSAGMKIAAQIPVGSAKEILASDAELKLKQIENVLSSIDSERSTYRTDLLSKIVDDRKLAISSLIITDEWKSSENAFINFITANVNQNGFNGRIFNLSGSEWNELFIYLKSIL